MAMQTMLLHSGHGFPLLICALLFLSVHAIKIESDEMNVIMHAEDIVMRHPLNASDTVQLLATITIMKENILALQAHVQALLTTVSTQTAQIEMLNASCLSKSDATEQFLPQSPTEIQFSDGSIQATAAVTLLPPNIISNAYMNNIGSDGLPEGWSINVQYCSSCTLGGEAAPEVPISTMTVDAVHPFTMCFEGPYQASAPTPAASTCDQATESTPYFFGRYNMGPRSGRGGLSGGWGSLGDGNILKVTGIRTSDFYSLQIVPPKAARIVVNGRLWLRCWLKIIEGAVSFNTDLAIIPTLDQLWTKNQSDAALNGWLKIDQFVFGESVTDLNGVYQYAFSAFGTDNMTDMTGSLEFYLALPYLANVGGLSAGWMPSIMDTIRDESIDPFGG